MNQDSVFICTSMYISECNRAALTCTGGLCAPLVLADILVQVCKYACMQICAHVLYTVQLPPPALRSDCTAFKLALT